MFYVSRANLPIPRTHARRSLVDKSSNREQTSANEEQERERERERERETPVACCCYRTIPKSISATIDGKGDWARAAFTLDFYKSVARFSARREKQRTDRRVKTNRRNAYVRGSGLNVRARNAVGTEANLLTTVVRSQPGGNWRNLMEANGYSSGSRSHPVPRSPRWESVDRIRFCLFCLLNLRSYW